MGKSVASVLLIKIPDKFIRHVLHKVTHLAIKVAAQPINVLGTGAESPPVDHLRQGHTMDANTLCNFSNANAPPLLELLAGDHFFDLETKHIGYIRYQ